MKPSRRGFGHQSSRLRWGWGRMGKGLPGNPQRDLLAQAHTGPLDYSEAMQVVTMSFHLLGSLPSQGSTAQTRTNVSPAKGFTNVYPLIPRGEQLHPLRSHSTLYNLSQPLDTPLLGDPSISLLVPVRCPSATATHLALASPRSHRIDAFGRTAWACSRWPQGSLPPVPCPLSPAFSA